MKLQTLEEIEHSIGGRPRSKSAKVRIDFYVNEEDATKLKQQAVTKGLALSQLVRSVIREHLARNKS